MHGSKPLLELPASTWHVAPPESANPQWELDAALAVLARAREEWEALAHCETSQQTRLALQRRLHCAEQLVARIHGKLDAAQS